MNELSPIRTEDGAAFRYGKNATIHEASFSFFHLPNRGVLRSRLTALLAVGLLTALCNGCAHWGRVTESSPREVFSFTDDSAGNGYYEAGLAISKLYNRETFHIFLKDIPTTQAMPSPDDSPFLEDCLASKDAISIEPGATPNTVTIRADFHSPFAFTVKGDKKKATKSKSVSQWIKSCHCRTPEDELTGQCFSDRLVNIIANKLNKLTTPVAPKSTKSEVTTLTWGARQRIIREAGMPFGAFNVLAHHERGLTKHGDTLPYFGQLLRPGELLCFHSLTYSSTWHDPIQESVSTSEPAEPACFEWETLLRARYQQNPTVSLSTGIDPLSRWTNSWNRPEKATIVYGERRDGDRIVVSPDSIADQGEGPFRYALVFAKNEEFLLPFGPERDLIVQKKGQEQKKECDSTSKEPSMPQSSSPKDPGITQRGSFILLIRDERLVNYIRENFAKLNLCKVADSSGQEHKYTISDQPHEYLKCLVSEWGSTVGISIPNDNRSYKDWLLDVIVPSNVRPFVAFEILVDNQPVRVRAGMTLLNIIDRRLGLSAQVFDLRSYGLGTSSSEAPTRQETALIRDAAEGILYERRAGVNAMPVGLHRTKRLEDLLIPLTPGDRITWLN